MPALFRSFMTCTWLNVALACLLSCTAPMSLTLPSIETEPTAALLPEETRPGIGQTDAKIVSLTRMATNVATSSPAPVTVLPTRPAEPVPTATRPAMLTAPPTAARSPARPWPEVAVTATRAPTASLIPSLVSSPSATSQPPAIAVRETTVTILSYPYETHLRENLDSRYHLTVKWLDRAAYESSHPTPMPRVFRALVLENEYLRLTLLPELGGRIYQCIFKPTGRNIFYQNAVLKPTYWGPLPRERNWWLAAGGMEWALPVHEHGYEWGMPWLSTVRPAGDKVTVSMQDTRAPDRIQAKIDITLRAEEACFQVAPSVTNPTTATVPVQFWLNAILTLGTKAVSPQTEFVYPTDAVLVHSTGDRSLPGEKSVMSWPLFGGRDLAWYHHWTNWLGFFVPALQYDFVGAYNHETELGVVRIFSQTAAPGVKLFAFGRDFSDRGTFSDDGSDYFEIWGGANRSFWEEDNCNLPPDSSLGWVEYWCPFAGIGGFQYANRDVVLCLRAESQGSLLGVAAPVARRLAVTITREGREWYRREMQVSPALPAVEKLALAPTQLAGARVEIRGEKGQLLAEYTVPAY